MKCPAKLLIILSFVIANVGNYVCAFHNTSRYFPFFERPENYRYRNKHVAHIPIFITTAATAFGREGGNVGVPELWGKYDLQDILFSLKTVRGTSFVNPLLTEFNNRDFDSFALPFEVKSKVRGAGFILHYEHDLKVWNIVLGASLPIMFVDIVNRYRFDKNCFKNSFEQKVRNLTKKENDNLSVKMDKVRRQIHDELGFCVNDWVKSGIGDLDLYIRFNNNYDHKLLMRGFSLNLQLGTVVPTGHQRDENNPASVPFMSDGHWTLYADFAPEFELKQDLKLGFLFSAAYQIGKTRSRRIAVYQEPDIFSALRAKVEVGPGATFKISPYITLENLADGLHIQGRYTYLRHNGDKWHDARGDKSIPSYLNLLSSDSITKDDLERNKDSKRRRTSWRSHYITLQALYDTRVAFNNWWLSPNFYLMWDMPISARGIAKTHQITFGTELHF